MKNLLFATAAAAAMLLPASVLAQSAETFRVLFGVADSAPTRWDGTVSVREGGKYDLKPWRFEGADGISGSLFHLTTHAARLFSGSTPAGAAAIIANGLLIDADSVTENTEINVTTSQGDFSFKASDLPLGVSVYKLGGRVYVDRIPASDRLTDTKEEEDYPATASAPN